MARLSVRSRCRRRGRQSRTAASRPTPMQPSQKPSWSSYFCPAHRGLPAAAKPKHHQESSSESTQSSSDSEFELDSPPRLTFIPVPEEPDTPGTPTSPPGVGLPPSSAVSPTFGDEEDDLFFKSLEENVILVSENDECKSVLLKNEAGYERQSYECAVSALMHYNNDKNNKVKYELISAISSCGIIDEEGIYGHVNFIAKGDHLSSKEELFFAELLWDHDTYVPTCVLSLEGEKTVDGLSESKYDNISFVRNGFLMDANNCYACGRGLKHPKDGTLYKTGHVAHSDYYHS